MSPPSSPAPALARFPAHSPVLLMGTRLLAVLAGLAAALAQPPWGFLPGLLGYGVLFRLVDLLGSRSRWRSAFALGSLCGFGYFVPSVGWLIHPFQVDAEAQGWMAPFAVGLMAAGLALFWGVAAAVYRSMAGRGPRRVLLFAGVLALFEWLRGHLLTGFPWDLPGETWRAGSAPSQAASLVGAYGLTWITLLAAAAPFTVLEGWRGRVTALAGAAIVGALYAFGAGALATSPAVDPRAPWVRIVQADVKQESKYDERLFSSIVTRYVALTARPAGRRPDIVVWPEGAIPAAMEAYLAPGAWTRDAILGALTPGQTLILGGYRFGTAPDGTPVTFNSLAVIDRSAGDLAVAGLYDKYRLTPFGEFMPFDSVATRWGIKQFVHVGDGFTPGPRPRPLRLAGLPIVQPLICYEALFPGFTREGAASSGLRAAWIVNISNDAWFGTGIGPRQHLNIASYRAIEEGLPMVRATPTGISAIIDAHGRGVRGERLAIGAYGVVDGPLPPALAPTLYSRLGDGPFWLMLALSLLGLARPRVAWIRRAWRRRARRPA
jgi:apolipoprotein N-acyltransferase